MIFGLGLGLLGLVWVGISWDYGVPTQNPRFFWVQMHGTNLSPKQQKFLRKYVKEKPFNIIQCDKNIGSCILSNKLLDEIVLGTLNNRDWNDAYARATLC